MKGANILKVSYDRKHDVVSIYFDKKEEAAVEKSSSVDADLSQRDYEIDEAAGLILDMVDLVDGNGRVTGFRVFNASKYYDLELLKCADPEVLEEKELLKIPEEKVIAQYSPKHKLIVTEA